MSSLDDLAELLKRAFATESSPESALLNNRESDSDNDMPRERESSRRQRNPRTLADGPFPDPTAKQHHRPSQPPKNHAAPPRDGNSSSYPVPLTQTSTHTQDHRRHASASSKQAKHHLRGPHASSQAARRQVHAAPHHAPASAHTPSHVDHISWQQAQTHPSQQEKSAQGPAQSTSFWNIPVAEWAQSSSSKRYTPSSAHDAAQSSSYQYSQQLTSTYPQLESGGVRLSEHQDGFPIQFPKPGEPHMSPAAAIRSADQSYNNAEPGSSKDMIFHAEPSTDEKVVEAMNTPLGIKDKRVSKSGTTPQSQPSEDKGVEFEDIDICDDDEGDEDFEVVDVDKYRKGEQNGVKRKWYKGFRR